MEVESSPGIGGSVRVSRLVVLVLSAALLLVTAAVALAACAGELPVPGKMTTITGNAATTSTTESQTVQLARLVAATWSEAIQKLIPIFQGTPPAASIQPAVSQLKEQYVQKMVALGRQIAALNDSDRQEVYNHTSNILDGWAEADWFTSYKNLYGHYAAIGEQTTQDFAILLSTFNTLTEYAFFDVLKDEDPAEAARLGIQ